MCEKCILGTVGGANQRRVLCAGVQQGCHSSPLSTPSLPTSPSPPFSPRSEASSFLCCFFVKMTGPNRINKAPIFTWLLAGWSHTRARRPAPVLLCAVHEVPRECWHLTLRTRIQKVEVGGASGIYIYTYTPKKTKKVWRRSHRRTTQCQETPCLKFPLSTQQFNKPHNVTFRCFWSVLTI